MIANSLDDLTENRRRAVGMSLSDLAGTYDEVSQSFVLARLGCNFDAIF